MTLARQQQILQNLFSGAHEAVQPFATFPFHRYAHSARSSQAMAIDLFGTIQQAGADRDAILNELAQALGLPRSRTWDLCLEWKDPLNRLGERRPSQVDAVARGEHSLIFFECKLTESDGGACSQPGRRACNGHFEPQRAGAGPVAERCALAAKGIKYWDHIPMLFRYDVGVDYHPCPFAGPWYQWMRNIVLCHRVAADEGLMAAFVIVYADKPGLPMSDRLQGQAWWDELKIRLRPGLVEVKSLSYQQAARIALDAAQHNPQLFVALEQHVLSKIARL